MNSCLIFATERSRKLDAIRRLGVISPMHDLGKMLFIVGLALTVFGALLWLGKGFRLPGDIYLERGNFSFGFPVVTCIVISIVLTILLSIFRR